METGCADNKFVTDSDMYISDDDKTKDSREVEISEMLDVLRRPELLET